MPLVPIEQAIKENPDYVKQNYPQVYSQYTQQVNQPGASLQQTQTSTAATNAQIPGIKATSSIDQVKANQAQALQNLGKDLDNKMTLPTALKKYTALGMHPDDIFSQYLSESKWGLPNQSPSELHNMGISAKALGNIGENGTFADRWNTKNAISGLRNLQDLWNKTNAGSRLGGMLGMSVNSSNYETAREIFGNHLSTLIPGAPGGQQTAKDLLNTLPETSDMTENISGKAQGKFNTIEEQLLKTKGYNYKDIGLSDPNGASGNAPQSKASTGGGLLNMILPAAGATLGGAGGALIPVLGETGVGEIGGAAVGGAGGQALADVLTGKKPGSDVAVTGGLSAIGGGVGRALGGILGKVGSSIASKMPGDVFNKVVSASPNYTTDVTALKNTAGKYGLMDGNTAQGLSQMPKIMNNIGTQIQDKLSQVQKPVNLVDVTKSILSDFGKKTNAFENSQDFSDAQKYIENRIYSATGNDKPLSSILSANGAPMAKGQAQTTYSALYKLKTEVANDLKPVFKAQANPNLNTNFTPKQEANLSLWNGLKSVIDKADPEIRKLNDDQHNMFDIAKGFVKDLNTKKGGSSLPADIFGTLAGNMVGGPLGAIGGLTAERAARAAIGSEGGRAAVSKFLQSSLLKRGLSSTTAGASAGLGGILGQ